MLKQISLILVLFSLSGIFLLAQDKPETDKKVHTKMNHMESDSSMDRMEHDMKSGSVDDESIIREGEIDLDAIDENGDGMVFQDQMCWNVISDKAGECPQCGMTLKEVTIKKAKENLLKHEYKVK